MKRTVLVFGLISGVISSLLMFATMPLINRGTINIDNGEVIGYTAIFLSLLLVFFGIRSYRDNVGGGTISFGRAFAVGILITLISCGFYVATWEILYFKVMPDNIPKYIAAMAARMRAHGASDAAIAARVKQLEQMKPLYDNPLTNAAMSFIEPFPVGLVVTLVSAGILRRRRAPLPPARASAAA